MNKLFFAGLIVLSFIACTGGEKPTTTDGSTAADTAGTPAEPQQAEFADAKYTEMCKRISSQFEKGDIDGWVGNYADDARYYWSAGDSLIGKPAIQAYWKDRFTSVIDSLSYSDQVYLPMKVNKPQANELPGIWLLTWNMVHVKYKTGKKLSFWAHNLHHVNAADKIDQTVSFIDRAPILAATAK